MKLRKRSFPGSAIRLSSKNFGFEDGLYSIPLYAAFCIDGSWAEKTGSSAPEF